MNDDDLQAVAEATNHEALASGDFVASDELAPLAAIDQAALLFHRAFETAPRDKIMALQAAVDQCPSTLAELVPKHHFAPGSYARELFVPAGRIVVGKIHKHAHVNVLSQGHCTVFTEDGLVELQAPLTFVSSPGTKRVVLTHTDIVWTTVHVTNETDLAKLEAELIVPSYDELDQLAHVNVEVLQ